MSSWSSRTTGAPSMPVASEEEMSLEMLQRARDAGAITPEQYQRAAANMRARVAGEGAPLGSPAATGRPPAGGGADDDELRRRLFSMGMRGNPSNDPEVESRNRSARAAFIQDGLDDVMATMAGLDARHDELRRKHEAERAREAMPAGPMTGTTEDYQDYAGIPRNPMSRLAQEGQDLADGRMYGSPVGGGPAFTSEGQRAAYNRRGVLPQSERNEMAARGMTPGQIVDAQRSQSDRDMAKSGISGSAGWAPVYVNGKVVYMERAPDDTTLSQPAPREKRPAPPPAPVPDRRMQTWMHSTLPHSAIGWPEEPAATPPPPPEEVVPDYSGEPRHELGMTNAAEGNRRTGPRVEAGEFSPSLGGRTDLEDRGYVQQTMQGPYGPERVWVKKDVGFKARERLIADGMPLAEAGEMSLEDYQERQRTEGIRRRLMNSAGISSTDAAGMSVAQIRELAKDRRAAQKSELSDAARLARMGGRQRNEMALGQMPEDWQNAVAARQFDMSQTTPLDVESQQAAAAWRNLQAALVGGDPLASQKSDMAMASMGDEDKVRLSVHRREPMGEGLSAAHVQSRYRYWMLDWGVAPTAERERRFRGEMEGLGYKPEEIDRFLDARRAGGDAPPPAPFATPAPGPRYR